ncbi:MAG TPA: purine-nucleoside phosphorylase, partial [Planctomycetota bacterium]|nr:purine-nucleoside phosphorylase [Planctomycetota bacterium]
MAGDDLVRRAADFLQRRLPALPQSALVLGSGLGDLDLGPAAAEIPYDRLPGFPRVQVAGHPGRLSLVGKTAILRGRVHYYEGRSLEEVTRPVRVLARLGVKRLVLTNAAGGI